ncbi:MAG: hypothetical protein Q8J90_08680 [Gallionella sp.]|nr:hypothetical protein [Gallionella sp.]
MNRASHTKKPHTVQNGCAGRVYNETPAKHENTTKDDDEGGAYRSPAFTFREAMLQTEKVLFLQQFSCDSYTFGRMAYGEVYHFAFCLMFHCGQRRKK